MLSSPDILLTGSRYTLTRHCDSAEPLDSWAAQRFPRQLCARITAEACVAPLWPAHITAEQRRMLMEDRASGAPL